MLVGIRVIHSRCVTLTPSDMHLIDALRPQAMMKQNQPWHLLWHLTYQRQEEKVTTFKRMYAAAAVEQWSLDNHLTLNPPIFKWMLISRRYSTQHLSPHWSFSFFVTLFVGIHLKEKRTISCFGWLPLCYLSIAGRQFWGSC